MTAPNGLTPPEPVLVSEVVRLAAVVVAAIGWGVIPVEWVNILISAAGVVVSIVASIRARGRVTPVPDSPPVGFDPGEEGDFDVIAD